MKEIAGAMKELKNEVAELRQSKSGPSDKITDVGEKIGGARKDISEKTGPHATREKTSEVPGWRKRYEVSQVATSTRPDETGRWFIYDTRKEDWRGHSSQVGDRNGYATKEEAEVAIPTDKGAAIYSQAPALPESEWLSAGEISQITEELVAQFSHKPPVVILDRASEAGLPETVDATGFVRDGKIHLVRAGLGSRADVVKTFWHELLHYGLRHFMTREQYISAMHNLALRDAWIRAKASAWVKNDPVAAGLREKGETEAYLLARGVDEALADITEDSRGDFKNAGLKARVIRAVSRWIATLADRLGFKEAAARWRGITNDEARDLIRSIFTNLRDDAQAVSPDVTFTADAAFMAGKRDQIKYHADQIAKYAWEAGWSVERETGSVLSGSRYLELSRVTERDADGEPSDWENVKIRVSDHKLPPTYKLEHGAADFEVVPDSASHDDASGDWRAAIRWLAEKAGQPVPAPVRRAESAEAKRAETEKREHEQRVLRSKAERQQAARDYSPDRVEIERHANGANGVTARFGALSASNSSPIPERAEARARRALESLVMAIREGNDPDKGVAMFSRRGVVSDRSPLTALWTMLAQQEKAFQQPTSTRKEMRAIAADIDPGIKVEDVSWSERARSVRHKWEFAIPDGRKAYITE